MPLPKLPPDTIYSLRDLTGVQGRMLVLMMQAQNAYNESDGDQLEACHFAVDQLQQEDETEAIQLGRKLEALHQMVGCSPGCNHIKQRSSN